MGSALSNSIRYKILIFHQYKTVRTHHENQTFTVISEILSKIEKKKGNTNSKAIQHEYIILYSRGTITHIHSFFSKKNTHYLKMQCSNVDDSLHII